MAAKYRLSIGNITGSFLWPDKSTQKFLLLQDLICFIFWLFHGSSRFSSCPPHAKQMRGQMGPVIFFSENSRSWPVPK